MSGSGGPCFPTIGIERMRFDETLTFEAVLPPSLGGGQTAPSSARRADCRRADRARPLVHIVSADGGLVRDLQSVLHLRLFDVRCYNTPELFLRNAHIGDDAAWQCLVCEMRPTGVGGAGLLRELQRQERQLPTIFLASGGDLTATVDAMRAGALSVLCMPVPLDELLGLIDEARAEAHDPATTIFTLEMGKLLTPRQRDVLNLAMQGLKTKEVARKLGLSHRTVEVHRAHILRRLGYACFSEILRDMLRPGSGLGPLFTSEGGTGRHVGGL